VYYYGAPKLKVDGLPSPETIAALKLFQKDAGLEITGRFDYSTKRCVDLVSHTVLHIKPSQLAKACLVNQDPPLPPY
jgi:peptidoglycan hydrolase-like protein with peptidoglycan-binding domain